MPQKPGVLFYACGVGQSGVKEWFPVAEILRQHGHDVTFLIDKGCSQEWIEKCQQAGFQCREHSADTRRAGLWVRLARAMPIGRRFIRAWFDLQKNLRQARQLLAAESPAAIVLFTDTFTPEATAITTVANEKEIPTLVSPLAANALPKGVAIPRLISKSFRKIHSVQRLRGRILARLFPQWVFNVFGTRMFYQPVGRSLAASLLGMLPKFPYSRAGGDATHVAVPSEIELDTLREEGVETKKMSVTGRTWFDTLQHSLADKTLRAHTCETLGLNPEKRIVLWNVPYYSADCDDRWPLQQHLAEIEFSLDTFTTIPDVQVVMSFHPGVDIRLYEQFQKKFQGLVSLARDDTPCQDFAQLASICDVVVSEHSSVVPVAIGANKPALVIHYFAEDDDCEMVREYRFDPQSKAIERLYADSGCKVIQTRDQLLPSLRRLFEDDSFYATTAMAQRRVMDRWIVVDGQCGQRIADVIESMVDSTSAQLANSQMAA